MILRGRPYVEGEYPSGCPTGRATRNRPGRGSRQRTRGALAQKGQCRIPGVGVIHPTPGRRSAGSNRYEREKIVSRREETKPPGFSALQYERQINLRKVPSDDDLSGMPGCIGVCVHSRRIELSPVNPPRFEIASIEAARIAQGVESAQRVQDGILAPLHQVGDGVAGPQR